jgi:general stress protein 26
VKGMALAASSDMAQQRTEGSSDDTKRFFELVRSFDNAILVTHTPEGEDHARPMAVADVTGDGDVWFVTRERSPKTAEVSRDSRVLVVAQGRRKFLTLSGRAEVKHDPERVRELWSDEWRTWFEGEDDPEIVLLCVHGENGEYWDDDHTNGLKLDASAAKSVH